MRTEIIAPITGIIATVTTGIIAAGSALFTTEIMKMYAKENSPVPGIFEAAVAVGAVVIAGETIIGYFTYEE